MSGTTLSSAQLAALDRAGFVAAFGEVFEHSPWVAGAAWAGAPFGGAAGLHAAMMAAVRAQPVAGQVAFLNHHPELAGREAAAGAMTGHSTDEQRSAGLGEPASAALDELRRLNAEYRARHGFPFIIAVRGRGLAEIVAALRERLPRATEVEREAALEQVGRITRGRLDALIADA